MKKGITDEEILKEFKREGNLTPHFAASDESVINVKDLKKWLKNFENEDLIFIHVHGLPFYLTKNGLCDPYKSYPTIKIEPENLKRY